MEGVLIPALEFKNKGPIRTLFCSDLWRLALDLLCRRLMSSCLLLTLSLTFSDNKMNSLTHLDLNSPALSSDSVQWTIPALAEKSERGLETVSPEVLQQNLEPVLQGLEQIDPCDLFPLEKVAPGCGPRISDRYASEDVLLP